MTDEETEGEDRERELYDDEDDEESSPGDKRRRRLERLIRDGIRGVLERGLEAGLGTINRTDRALKSVTSGELPRELVGYVFSQVDETKNALVRVVAREVREFLEATDVAQELQKALTSLSFEIKTEIRFIPNEAGGVKPNVKARVRPRKSEPPPKGARDDDDDRDHDEPPGDED